MMGEKIDIVVCTDKWYVMPTGVMMYSVCVNNQDSDITFHIIVDESVTLESKDNLKNTVERFGNKRVVFYEINSHLIDNYPTRKEKITITQAAYYRLFLTDIITPNINKVLYLDGDTIVRHSLTSLWETDLSGYALAAVTDMSSGKIEYYNRLRYPIELGYFNSGVLLINLDWWRKNSAVSLFMEYIKKYYERIKFQDQDVLNAVFLNQVLFLPVTYNFQHGFLKKIPDYDYWKYEKEVEKARKDPVIVHYTLGKPWEKTVPDFHPFASTFTKYQKQTIWRNCKKIDRRSTISKIRFFIGQILRHFGLRQRSKTNIYIDVLPVD